ncbi:hypothetical protein [Nocardia sp. NPDC057668]|uniref:hypothetical protein n=1 Tax=Nocardia sp. NPDC057668 TaxID=3346202 RepID=UPI00366EF080
MDKTNADQPVSTFACSPDLAALMTKAEDIAVAGSAPNIGVEHVLLAMLADPGLIVRAGLAIADDPRVVFVRLGQAAARGTVSAPVPKSDINSRISYKGDHSDLVVERPGDILGNR